MSRTRELARATLDTAHNLFAFATLPVLQLREFGQQIRLQTHRTSRYALGATDALLGLLTTSLIIGDNRHRVGSLADRHLGRGEGLTHHRSTSQQLIVALGHTTTGVNEILHRCTHAHEEVARIGQALTSNCGIALEEGLALHHGLVDGEGCTYILHDGTHIHRDSGRRRHLATDHSIDELFLTSLRITLLKGNYFNIEH